MITYLAISINAESVELRSDFVIIYKIIILCLIILD